MRMISRGTSKSSHSIYPYFVHTARWYTNEEIEDYRSLEAYNYRYQYVKSGHIKKMKCMPKWRSRACKGAVMPSQRLSKNKPYPGP